MTSSEKRIIGSVFPFSPMYSQPSKLRAAETPKSSRTCLVARTTALSSGSKLETASLLLAGQPEFFWTFVSAVLRSAITDDVQGRDYVTVVAKTGEKGGRPETDHYGTIDGVVVEPLLRRL
jgi:hypothetical protein